MDKKQDFLNAAKNSLCVWCCEMSDTQEYNLKNFIKKAMEKIEEAYDAGYHAAQGATKEEENSAEIPEVIIVTDEIKKMFPELKNISMIQTEPVSDKTWPEAMEYAKNLRLGGFNDWRLPTCSGDEDDRSVNNELCGICRAKKVLGIPEDYYWYWSGAEYNASYAWRVYFDSSGDVSYYSKSSAYYVRCVR